MPGHPFAVLGHLLRVVEQQRIRRLFVMLPFDAKARLFEAPLARFRGGFAALPLERGKILPQSVRFGESGLFLLGLACLAPAPRFACGKGSRRALVVRSHKATIAN